MKIKSIEPVRLKLPPAAGGITPPRRPAWTQDAEVANPMSRFPRFKRHRSSWRPPWENVGVKVTAENGQWGYGQTSYGRPVAAIIDDHFAPHLLGENCFAIEKLWDMMFRLAKPYGAQGLAASAISGVDLALWDLVGKLLDKPVYELIGGPVRDRIFTYATGNDVDWYKELGFKAFKLACPYGPVDGLEGLERNEAFIAEKRSLIGDHLELMLDCYMAFDVEYTVRLAERIRPLNLRWIEEYLIPEDIRGLRSVREAVNWVSLAGGEHLTSRFPFQQIIEDRSLDILQADINWVGGLSECVRICHGASAAGLEVCLHAGANQPYGQHLSIAMPNIQWLECFIPTAPGVPMNESPGLPGTPVPVDGYTTPSNAPGFGLEIKEEWLEPFFA